MFDFHDIEDNSIILLDSGAKSAIIQEQALQCPEKRIKFMDRNEFIKGFTYTYDMRAIKHIHDVYGYSYQNAKEIAENLKSVSDKTDKLLKLKKIKEDLEKEHLLQRNPYFSSLFKGKKFYIYGYSSEDVELNYYLKKYIRDYCYLEEEKKDYSHVVFSYSTAEEETLSAINEMLGLYENGIPFEKIFFYQPPSEYSLLLRKYAEELQLPLSLGSETVLHESPIYREFLEEIKALDEVSEENLQKALDKISQNIILDPYDALGRIVSVCNEIMVTSPKKEEFLEMMDFLSNSKRLKEVRYQHAIQIIDSNAIPSEDSHVFMLGFSLGSYPKITKDTDFYSDEEKHLLGLCDSKTLTAIDKEALISFLRRTENIHISYKKKQGKQVYYPSLLVNELHMEEREGEISAERYSLPMTKNEVASYFDDKAKYGKDNPYLNSFSKEEIGYNSYDHKFKGISDFKEKRINLSASSVNSYNKCKFQYFVRYILKANIFEGTFQINLGNLFHKILENDVKGIEYKREDYQSYIDETFTTAKEKFFLDLCLPQVEEVLKKNHGLAAETCYTDIKAEVSADEMGTIKIDDRTYLTGKIDKLMIDEEDSSAVIIDYKTGDFHFNVKKASVGLDNQLPVYAYIIRTVYQGKYSLTGIYIQNILLDKNKPEDKDNYKLIGLTVNDLEKIKRFDRTIGSTNSDGKEITESTYVKGIALTKKKELGKKAGLVDPSFLNDLSDVAEQTLHKTADSIWKADFSISPVMFNSQLRELPCEFCPCADICFHDYKDTVVVSAGDEDESDKEEE